MATRTVKVKNKIAYSTRADWMATNKPIDVGVMCYESDTGRAKVGDGLHLYSELGYMLIDEIIAVIQQGMDARDEAVSAAETSVSNANSASESSAAAITSAIAAANATDVLVSSSVIPSLDLRPVAGWTPPMATFSRASAATRVNERGLLESVAAGVLRADFDPVTGRFLGWLLEGAATNAFRFSNDLTQGSWLTANCSINGAMTAIGPDGALSLQKVVEAADANQSHAIRQNLSLVAGTPITIFAYARAAERSIVQIAISGGAFTDNVARRARFDLLAGTAALLSGTSASTKITPFGNGLHRIELTITPTISVLISLVFELVGPNGSLTYSGDGVSGVYLGFMNCQNLSFASSHIYTTSAEVTRAADILYVQTSKFPLNLAEGTLFVETEPLAVKPGSVRVLAALNDGSNNNRVMIRLLANNQIELFVTTSVGTPPTSKTIANNGKSIRAAVTWGAQQSAAAVNGVGIGAPNIGDMPVTFTYLHCGYSSSWQVDGCIRRIAVFQRALSAAELQLITGGQS